MPLADCKEDVGRRTYFCSTCLYFTKNERRAKQQSRSWRQQRVESAVRFWVKHKNILQKEFAWALITASPPHLLGSVPFFKGQNYFWRGEDTDDFCRSSNLSCSFCQVQDVRCWQLPVTGGWIICHPSCFAFLPLEYGHVRMAEQEEVDGETTAPGVLFPLFKSLFPSKRLTIDFELSGSGMHVALCSTGVPKLSHTRLPWLPREAYVLTPHGFLSTCF